MRYRPFNLSGLSASAITLVLEDAPGRAEERLKLIYAALELGVNSFELATADPLAAEQLGHAIEAAGRRVLVLTLRLARTVGTGSEAEGFSPANLEAGLDAALARTGARAFDALVLDGPEAGELSAMAMDVLQQAKGAGKVAMVGLAAAGELADAYLARGGFDLLCTPFNVGSGWPERNRIKNAVARSMTVMGCDYDPFADGAATPSAADEETRPKGLGRLFHRHDPETASRYDFLHRARDWTADQLALAFALTEPAIATVLVKPETPEALEALADAVEREIPTGVAAQIEMARFSVVS